MISPGIIWFIGLCLTGFILEWKEKERSDAHPMLVAVLGYFMGSMATAIMLKVAGVF